MRISKDRRIKDLEAEKDNVSPAELQKQGLRVLANIIARAHLSKVKAGRCPQSDLDDELKDEPIKKQ